MTTLREKHADRILARARSIYKRERAKQWRTLVDHYNTPSAGTGRLPRINRGTRFAAAAWDHAKTEAAFEEYEAAGLCRITFEPDDLPFDDLAGDCYNPDANPDVKPHVMEREKQEFIDRINRDGQWFARGEYFGGQHWHDCDSIGGFVGDDFHGSGYDVDVMNALMDAADTANACPHCGESLAA